MTSRKATSENAFLEHVREGREEDLPAINDIYNHYVLQSHATFDIEPISMKQRLEWFGHYGSSGRHRLLVTEIDGDLVGYASSSRVRPKPAYSTSIETSVYIAPNWIGQGIGSTLYRALFKSLEGEDIHRAYAGIALPNPASVQLHERFGFERVAYFTEQGRKFDKYWDVAWFEKPL